VLAGDGLRVFALAPGKLVVGRASDNDIAIDDASVSRRHAVIHVGERLTIEDLGGANGTRIRCAASAADSAGTRKLLNVVRETVELGPGDCVSLGSTLLVIRHRRAVAPPGDDVVAFDEGMRVLLAQVRKAAPSRVNILLLGETGVGKEVIARAVHAWSPRAAEPFVPLHCAALTPSLFESELFGHEKGAFSGATHARSGLLETAEGGTVFLDEVGEIPLEIQTKLLRVVEDRSVQRVGARRALALDVRFVSATNRDLEAAASLGTFRHDLFFRLNTLTLTVPPLRDRPSDVLPLARMFATRAFADLERPGKAELSVAFADALLAHTWPGNVRELRNVIERAAALCDGVTLSLEHLPPALATPREPSRRVEPSGAAELERAAQALASERVRAGASERERILFALESCGGNQTEAARMLGISRRTLISRIEQHGLPRPRKKS
jgi:DNA-binding NtrC family response regulator